MLLHLAERQNEILMNGLQERVEAIAPLSAITGLVRRGIETFIDMQQHFLTIAAKQADDWVDAGKSGERFSGKGLAELARESVENFVRSQKKFLDAIAEETANATGKGKGHTSEARNTELAEMAREGAEAFIDAQKKLLDVAAQQMAVSVATARRSIDVMNPLPASTVADLTRQTVDAFVAAQKALLDVAAKPARAAAKESAPPPKAQESAPPKPPKRPTWWLSSFRQGREAWRTIRGECLKKSPSSTPPCAMANRPPVPAWAAAKNS